ncbi:multidrug ABC transporter permease (plasmid) [Rhodococcus oxybenzonivorans]|uniref:Multidrug ABC transporter permease n=1 Tax=Rhodococcus oxybenzonivorans TaxID=1990687 RepID=A0A2S2C5G5_9NOCA|nr:MULTISPECIES: ABC transporter permease [Rhodococcus]AWK76141.1 multidrug ABC transporter permease [Rhodococcus oxybenzonivorans]WAM19267.1 ABC transporter permease [Rhodococcus sp. JS3073]
MTNMTFPGTHPQFSPGTFTPAPRTNTVPAVLTALTRLETTLLLRNGEQLLLTMLLPITFLVGLTMLPIGDFLTPRVDTVLPVILAVAIMSTGFTGQAIAVGFDRRYGALKRLGANAIPKWAMLTGKSAAVVIVVSVQSIILGTIGAALGWRPSVNETLTLAAVIALGTATFAALGLLLGGSLPAEIVLALANVLWFVQLGFCGISTVSKGQPSALQTVVDLTPSGALASALRFANEGTMHLANFTVLTAWAVAAIWLARKTFKFS